MKNHAQGITIRAFNLVVSDDALTQWRTKYNILPSEMSDDEVQARILKGSIFELLTDPLLSRVFPERITGLIGTTDHKDSFFIYGGGTVSHLFLMEHQPSLLKCPT